MNVYEQIEAFGYQDENYAASLAAPDHDDIAILGGDVVERLDATMVDTLLDVDREPLLHAIIAAVHRRAQHLARDRHTREEAARECILAQDGSEIADVQLQQQQRELEMIVQREDALIALREAMAGVFEQVFNKPWTPPVGGRAARGVTASTIEARDYLRGLKEKELMAKAPEGTPVAVAGGPDFEDHKIIFEALDKAQHRVGDMVLLHGGMNRGADKIAALWAKERGVPCVIFKPDFKKGSSAPFRRNDEIIRMKPRAVVLFPGNGISENLGQKANDANIPVWRPVKIEDVAA